MVYYKKRRGGYSKTRRPFFGRMDRKIARVTRNIVRPLLNSEIKSHDHDEPTVTLAVGGETHSLFDPIQGLAVNHRVGNSVKVVGISIFLILKMNPAATQTNIRVILFWDRQANSNKVSPAGLLENTAPDSYLENHMRYRIAKIFDTHYSYSISAKQGGLYRKGKRMSTVVKFDGGVSIPTKNALVLLVISDEQVNLPTFRFKTRIKYVDN